MDVCLAPGYVPAEDREEDQKKSESEKNSRLL